MNSLPRVERSLRLPAPYAPKVRVSPHSITPSMAGWLFAVPFCTAVLDSLVNYFMATFHAPIRVGVISLAALVMLVAIKGFWVLRTRDWVLAALAALFVAFVTGVLLVPELGVARIIQAIGVIVYFYCGYVFFRWVRDPSTVLSSMAAVSILYAGVCILALLKIAPSWFPIVDSWVLKDGVFVSRPEVMTDQNFQMLYLIPAAIGFLIARGWVKNALFVVLLFVSAFILFRLGTRSGSLVFAGMLAIGLFACLKNPALGRKKAYVIPLVAIALGILAMPFLVEQTSLLVFRFAETGQEGALGRLVGTTYALERLMYPAWWLPQGTQDFRDMYTGHLPHSNIGGFYLDAGLIGLAAWCLLIVVPALRLGVALAKGGLDPVAAAVGCGAIGALVLQLSLYAVTDSQVWLWAGAAVGVIERLRSESRVRQLVAGSHPATP